MIHITSRPETPKSLASGRRPLVKNPELINCLIMGRAYYSSPHWIYPVMGKTYTSWRQCSYAYLRILEKRKYDLTSTMLR